jgi:hypothetical protein
MTHLAIRDLLAAAYLPPAAQVAHACAFGAAAARMQRTPAHS